jgi:hypothetical protein
VRKAIFLGGPCDGKAMLLEDRWGAQILLPVFKHERTAALYEAEELELQFIRHDIARYIRHPIAEFSRQPFPETKCDIYVFGGMQ